MLNESSRDTISGTMTVDESISWLSFWYSTVFHHDLFFCSAYNGILEKVMVKITTSALISSILPIMQHCFYSFLGQSRGQFRCFHLTFSPSKGSTVGQTRARTSCVIWPSYHQSNKGTRTAYWVSWTPRKMPIQAFYLIALFRPGCSPPSST